MKVQEIQWSECFASNVEEHGGGGGGGVRGVIFTKILNKYLETDFNPSGELCNPLIIPTKEPKAAFYISPGIIDSALLMDNIKFNTKSLTYYKN